MRLALALGAILSAGVCTGAMADTGVPNIEDKQVRQIDFTTALLYDSNVSHTSDALSAQRGIKPEDETVRPGLNFNVVQPVGREALFLSGFAGYDFHRYNKDLDHINADMTGGGLLNVGPCKSTIFGIYQASQSNPEDVVAARVRNLLTTTTEAISVACGRETGISEQLVYRHSNANNSNTSSKVADHDSDGVSGGVSYGNASLGSLGLVAAYSHQEFPNRQIIAGSFGDAYTSESIGVMYSRDIGSRLKGSVTLSDALIRRNQAPVGIPLKTSGLNYDVSGEYAVSKNLTVSLTGSRAYQPSNRPGKLYDLLTAWEVDGKYQLGTKMTLGLGAVFKDLASNVDSVTAVALPTTSHERDIYGSISYQATKRASLSFELRQEDKTTDVQAFNFTDTRATLSLDVTF
jgi:hypothetical protein